MADKAEGKETDDAQGKETDKEEGDVASDTDGDEDALVMDRGGCQNGQPKCHFSFVFFCFLFCNPRFLFPCFFCSNHYFFRPEAC